MLSGNFPYNAIIGEGLGYCRSSQAQIGAILPQHTIGQAKVMFYFNMANGNLVVEDYVTRVKEANGELMLGFLYNLQQLDAKKSWRFREEKHFYNLTKNHKDKSDYPQHITLEENDGHLTTYTIDADSLIYRADPFANGRPFLEYLSVENYWRWYDPATQLIEHYDADGKLIARIDLYNHKTTFEYNPAGELTAIQGPMGNRYEIRRQNKTVEIVAIINKQETLLQRSTFNDIGCLAQTEIFTKNKDPYTIKYVYPAADLPYLWNVIQSDGTDLSFMVNHGQGWVKLSHFKIGDNIGTITYAESSKDGYALLEDSEKFDTKFKIDSASRLIELLQIQRYIGQGSKLWDKTKYEYANEGFIKKITYPNEGEESFEYLNDGHNTRFGMLAKHIKPGGRVTEYTYDADLSYFVITERKAYQDSDPSAAKLTRYIYKVDHSDPSQDKPKILCFIINPAGKVTEYRYNGDYNLASIRDYLANTYTSSQVGAAFYEWLAQQDKQRVSLKEHEYNTHGLICLTRAFAHIDTNGEGITDVNMSETVWIKDLSGNELVNNVRQELVTPPKESITTKELDGLQRVCTIKNPLQQTTALSYGQGKITTAYLSGSPQQLVEISELDEAENVKTLKQTNQSEVSRLTTYVRDGNGAAYLMKLPDGRYYASLFDNLRKSGYEITQSGYVTEYNYVSAHRVKVITHYDNPIDFAELDIDFDFPEIDLLKETIKPNPAKDQVVTECYDASGRLVFSVDSQWYVTEYRYDNLNRKIATIQYYNKLSSNPVDQWKEHKTLALTPSSQDRMNQSFYYADTNELLGEQDAAGYVTEYKRDAAGRKIEKIVYANPTPPIFTYHIDNVRPANAALDARTSYILDARGQCVMEVDPKGFLTEYTYLANGLIEKKVERYNAFDAEWLKKREGIPPQPNFSTEDRETTYEYDLLNREIKRVEPNNAVVTTDYDDAGNVINHTIRDGNALNTFDPDHIRATEGQFNAWNEVIREANPYIGQLLINPSLTPAERQAIWDNQSTRHQLTDSGLKLFTLDSLGEKTFYYYNQDARPILSISPLGKVTEKTLNGLGQIIGLRIYEKTVPADKLATLTGGLITLEFRTYLDSQLKNDDKDQIYIYERDNRGLIVKTTDPLKNVTTTTYTPFAEKETEVLPVKDATNTMTVSYTYEARGLETSRTQSAGDLKITTTKAFNNPYGLVTGETDGEGNKVKKTYDERGDLHEEINAEEVVTSTLEYDAFRRIKRIEDALSNVTKRTYNLSERTETTETPVPGETFTAKKNIFHEKISLKNALDQSEQWQHTPDGQESSYTNDLNESTKSNFDLLGNIESKEDPSQLTTTYKRDAERRITDITIAKDENDKENTHYDLDTFGNAIAITDPRGNKTAQAFNKKNELLQKIIDPLDPAHPDDKHLNLVTTNILNAQGSLTSQVKGDAQNQKKYEEVIPRDGLNRVIGKVIAPDSLNIKTENELNANGLITISKDPNGSIKRHYYDNLNRERVVIDGEGGIYQCTYNAKNLLILESTYQKNIPDAKLSELTTLEKVLNYLKDMKSAEDSNLYHFYNANDQERFSVNSLGIVKETRYDLAGRQVETIVYATSINLSDIASLTTEKLVLLMASLKTEADRHTYSILDGAGQERFTILPNHALIEKQYNVVGQVIIETHYSTPVKDPAALAVFPVDEVLSHYDNAHPESNRIGYSFYDSYHRLQYSITPAGAITKFIRDKNGNIEQSIQFKDPMPVFNTEAERLAYLVALTPKSGQDRILLQKFDAANRCQEQTKVVNPTSNWVESFTHDALDNVVGRVDPLQGEWSAGVDAANRVETHTTPMVTVTTVTPVVENGMVHLTDSEAALRLQKKTEHDLAGNEIAVTEAANTAEARTLKSTYNRCNKPVFIFQENVAIDDNSNTAPTWDKRPEVIVSKLGTRIVYNAKQLKIAEQNENGFWSFFVHDSEGRVIYEIKPSSTVPLSFLGEGKEDDKKGKEPIRDTIRDEEKRSYAVVEYQYNTFGDKTRVTRYAQPINLNAEQILDLTLPFTTPQIGLTTQTVKNELKSNPAQDRTTSLFYNHSGQNIRLQLNRIFTYLPQEGGAKAEFAQPEVKQQFNVFEELEASNVLFQSNEVASESIWSESRQWLNLDGQIIIESKALTTDSSRLIEHTYDVWGREVYKREYARTLSPTALAGKTLAEVKKALADIASDELDRITIFEYGVEGDFRKETIKNEIVSHAVWSPQTPPVPAQINTEVVDVTREFYFDALKRPIGTTWEDGSSEYQYPDALGRVIAVTGVPRKSGAGEETLIPLRKHGINAFGQTNKTTDYAEGTASAQINVIPTPKAPNPDKDQTSLIATDSRGLPTWRQDALGHIIGNSFTPTKKLTREWRKLTNHQDPEHPTDPVYVVEKRSQFNHADLVARAELLRTPKESSDPVSVQETLYNAFQESIAEGGGDGQFPLYRHRDQRGHVWLTNEKEGAAKVTLTNLAGLPTVDIQSPTVDLSTQTYQDLPNLVGKTSDNGIQKEESERDLGGRITIKRLSPYAATDSGNTVHNIPITMVSGTNYPEFGQVSLTWLWPQERDVQMTLTLKTFKDKKELPTPPIKIINQRCGIDVSEMPSDVYNYNIIYTLLPDPADTTDQISPIIYCTEGQVQIAASKIETLQGIVTLVHDNHQVEIVGENIGSQLELLQGTTSVAQITVVEKNGLPYVDLSAYPSGIYTLKDTAGKVSLPFTIYTAQPSPVPLSRDLTFSLALNTTAQAEQLMWKIPEGLENQPVKIILDYVDNENQPVVFSSEALTATSTENGYLCAPFVLEKNIKAISGITFSIQMLTGEWAELANKLAPLPTKETETTSTVTFPKTEVVYISPSPLSYPEESFSFLDMTQDRLAEWITVDPSSMNASDHGLVINMDNQPPCVFPYKTGTGNSNVELRTFALTQGQTVYASSAPTDPKLLAVALPKTPKYQFERDVWNQLTAVTNTLNQTTKTTYTKRGARHTMTEPFVMVTLEDGSSIEVQPQTIWAINARGQEFGHTDPNGHVQVDILNEANQVLYQVGGDGVSTYSPTYDALQRKISYTDGRGKRWTLNYDKGNHLIENISPAGWSWKLTFNELGKKSTETTEVESKAVTRTIKYNYTAAGDISARLLPQGNRYRFEYDGRRHLLTELLPEGRSRSNTWDYFGNKLTHRDLGHVQTVYERNFMQQVTEQYVPIGEDLKPHGEHSKGYKGRSRLGNLYYDLVDQPTLGQHLKFEYRNHHITKIEDVTNDTLTEIGLDDENRRVDSIFKGGIDSQSNQRPTLQQSHSNYDACGRLDYVSDSGVIIRIAFDAAANRRRVSAYVLGSDGRPLLVADDWYRYNGANWMLISAGTLKDGHIDIAPGKGSRQTYIGGYLTQQIAIATNNALKTVDIFYNDDGLRNKMIATNPDGKVTETFDYSGSGTPSGYHKTTEPHHGKTTEEDERTREWTENGLPKVKTHDKSDIDPQTTTLHYLQTDLLQGQDTTDKEGVVSASGDMFVYFDSPLVSAKTLHVRYKGKLYTGTAEQFVDSNGFTRVQMNVAGDKIDAKKNILYETTTEGRMIARGEIDETGRMIKKMRAVHTPAGDYMATYTEGTQGSKNVMANYFTQQAWATSGGPQTLGIKDHIAALPNLTKQQHQALQGLSGYARVHGMAANIHKLKGQLVLDHLMSDASDPIQAPLFHIVREGETFSSIAAQYTSQSNYAQMIAVANGYLAEDATLTLGDQLRLPPFFPFTNKDGEFKPYNQFLNTMLAELTPFIDYHLKDRQSLVGLIVTAIVIAAAIAFSAGALAPFIVGALHLAGISAMAVTGMTVATFTALASAAEQAIAVQVGLQDHFSLSQALETGIVAGLTVGLGATASLGQSLATAAVLDVSTQLTEMALGLRRQFDFGQVLTSMAAQGVAHQLQVSLPQAAAGTAEVTATKALTNLASSSLQQAMNGHAFNLGTVAASSLGSTLGNEIGGAASDTVIHHAGRQFQAWANEGRATLSQRGLFASRNTPSLAPTPPSSTNAPTTSNQRGADTAAGLYGTAQEHALGNVLGSQFAGLGIDVDNVPSMSSDEPARRAPSPRSNRPRGSVASSAGLASLPQFSIGEQLSYAYNHPGEVYRAFLQEMAHPTINPSDNWLYSSFVESSARLNNELYTAYQRGDYAGTIATLMRPAVEAIVLDTGIGLLGRFATPLIAPTIRATATTLGVHTAPYALEYVGLEIFAGPGARTVAGIPGLSLFSKRVEIAENVKLGAEGLPAFSRKVYTPKSAEEMAAELSDEIGRNSVTFRTSSKAGHIDLRGRAHVDKTTGESIPTPHVQTYNLHKGPNGELSISRKSEVILPATKNDIRIARRLAEQKGLFNKLREEEVTQNTMRRGF